MACTRLVTRAPRAVVAVVFSIFTLSLLYSGHVVKAAAKYCSNISNLKDTDYAPLTCTFYFDKNVTKSNFSLDRFGVISSKGTSSSNISSLKDVDPAPLTCTFYINMNVTKNNISLVRFGGIGSKEEPTKVRLVNGTSEAGRLEVFFNGGWNTVCDSKFGKEEAQVACRMLGFTSTGAAAITSVRYGEGRGLILLMSKSCRGTETNLTHCENSPLYPQGCSHSQDVGVVCNITEPMKVRLVNGTSEAGRLEVFFNGEWGTVCGSEFGNKEAQVACRMLGFNSVAGVYIVILDYTRSTWTSANSLLGQVAHLTSRQNK